MKHPIIDYWKSAFSDFEISDNCYQSAEMPDPILSPRFVEGIENTVGVDYFNLLIPHSGSIPPTIEGFDIRNDFYLGRAKISNQMTVSPEFDVSVTDVTCLEEDHLKLLNDGFPQDYEFLQGLNKFLPTLRAKYRVGLIKNESGNALASVTMGISGGVAKLISGVVKSEFRDQKLSREIKNLVHQMGSRHGASETFFWTKTPRLIGYADRIDRYLIYIRTNNN